MKVYGHPMSTCTRKVLTTLAEKNHPAELVVIDLMKGEHKKPEFMALQPFGVVPVLDDDGFVLYESRAIMRYLNDRLPGASLVPADIQQRGLMEQFISVEHSYFSGPAMKIVQQKLFSKYAGKEPDQAVIDKGRADLQRPLEVLDKALQGRQFLAGNQFSLAEITYLPYIEYLFAAGNGDLITGRSNVAAWWERSSGRPSWRKATGK